MSSISLRAVFVFALILAGCDRGGSRDAERVRQYLERSDSYARNTLYVEAIQEAQKAVQTDPQSVAALTRLGRLYRNLGAVSGSGRDDRLGHYRRAREALEKAVKLAPRDPAPRIELALILSDSDQARAAASLLEPVATNDNPVATFHLASILASTGNYPRAVTLYARGLTVAPQDAAARLGYGIALVRTGQLEDARRELEAATRADPGLASAYHQLGLVLAKLSEPLLSRTALARAVDLDPTSEEALYALAMAYRRDGQKVVAEAVEGRFQKLKLTRERVGEIETALASKPKDAALNRELAEHYLARGQWLRAIGTAKKLLQLDPRDATAHRVLAEGYHHLGSDGVALAEADQAVDLAPSDPRPLVVRALLRLQAGRAPEAESDLVQAFARGSRDGRVVENLARLALARGDLAQTTRITRAGFEGGAPYPPLYKVMAQVYLTQGRTVDAIRILNACMLWRPADPEVLTQLANLAENAGDHAQASRLRARLAFVAPPTAAAAVPPPPHS